PGTKQALFDVAVPLTFFPIPEILVLELVAKEPDQTTLGFALLLAHVAHATASGFTRRARPVRRACIIPCLMALVFSRRHSSADISASMSDNTRAIAHCSLIVGSG